MTWYLIRLGIFFGSLNKYQLPSTNTAITITYIKLLYHAPYIIYEYLYYLAYTIDTSSLYLEYSLIFVVVFVVIEKVDTSLSELCPDCSHAGIKSVQSEFTIRNKSTWNIFSWEPALWTLMSLDRVMMRRMSKKSIAIFSYKKWL